MGKFKSFIICKSNGDKIKPKDLKDDIIKVLKKAEYIKLTKKYIKIKDENKNIDRVKNYLKNNFNISLVEDNRKFFHLFGKKPQCKKQEQEKKTPRTRYLSSRVPNRYQTSRYPNRYQTSRYLTQYPRNRYRIYRGGSKHVNIEGVGKRMVRFYKNGNPYVLVNGKKKKL